MTSEITLEKRREWFRWSTAALLSIVLFLAGFILNDIVDGGGLEKHMRGGPHPETVVILEGIQRDIQKIEQELHDANVDRQAMYRQLSELAASVSRLEGMLRAKGVVP